MPSQLLGINADAQGNTESIDHSDPPALPLICARIHARLEAFLAAEPATERLRQVQEQSRLSLRILEEALDRYSLDELSLSYNGGKDCLVLLILYLAALHKHAAAKPGTTTTDPKPATQLPPKLRSVYIISKNPFQEVDDFVADSEKTYHLDLARYAMGMMEAFQEYLQDTPDVKAIFVGTRRTDPHGATLKYFDPTDRGWPAFMRIHPVIDWHYAEVWTFIRHLDIPYCPLYDSGYTSLGGTTDTYPNPALREDPGGGEDPVGDDVKYRPAYELEQDEEERLGRDR